GGIGEIPNPTRPARQAESIGSINAQRASDRSLRYGRRAVLIHRTYQIRIHGGGMSGISPPSCLCQIITKWDEMPSKPLGRGSALAQAGLSEGPLGLGLGDPLRDNLGVGTGIEGGAVVGELAVALGEDARLG